MSDSYYGEEGRNFRRGGNPILPAELGPTPVIGWLDPERSLSGVAAHANQGVTGTRRFGYELYAGVVDYTAGTVVWSLQWTPTAGGASPTLTPQAAGKVLVNWPNDGTNDFFPSLGMLLLTATVDGTPTAAGQGLEAVTISSDYGTQAWAPEA